MPTVADFRPDNSDLAAQNQKFVQKESSEAPMRVGIKIFAVLVALLLPPLPLVADMYKWIDKDGKVHYTDSPPPGQKAKKLDLKINSITGPATVTIIGGTAATAKSTAKVKLYTTTWCGYCKRAKAYLQARGTPYQEIDVETSPQGQSEFQALGGRGVPVILVGNQRMDGYSEGTLAGMLKQAGL